MARRQTSDQHAWPTPRRLAALSCTTLVFVVSACAGDRTAGSTAGSSPSRNTTAGYAAQEHEVVTTSAHDWLLAGRTVKILLSEPVRPRSLPVVVYVPGLGESSAAGDRWRGAWAAAGYAVVSVQPLLEDEQAWNSELARDGEFKALGRERYSDTVTGQRLRSLQAILSEARRRSQSGEAGWARLDWDRAVIAGFDLGAYTAIALAEAPRQDVPGPTGLTKFRGVLALSPYASVPLRGRAAPGAIADLPLLAVTGDADGDPLGVVEASARKDRFFDRLQGPDRYFLLMAGLTHASLSGSTASERAAERHASSPTQDADAGDGSGGRQGRGRRVSSGGGSRPAKGRTVDGDAGPDLPAADTRARMEQAEQVTTAFLDAYLKNDVQAREWLAASVSSWLGSNGEMRRLRVPGQGG
jgi:dienelactone hydrolase